MNGLLIPKKNRYTITVFVDSVDSWILPWAQSLIQIINKYHSVTLCNRKEDIRKGDFNFLLGCTKILEEEHLLRNRLNLVIHESDLPKGRGWSPLSWQILEGSRNIPIVMFEARTNLDSGKIFLKDEIVLDGSELLPEIKEKQGKKTVEMVLSFLNKFPTIEPYTQQGTPSYYRRRTHQDDMLEVNKTIAQNFNRLRITDNEKYPAWFQINGQKYYLKIYKEK